MEIQDVQALLPREAIDELCDKHKTHKELILRRWERELKLKITKEQCIEIIIAYSSYNKTGLRKQPMQTLRCFVIWIAATNFPQEAVAWANSLKTAQQTRRTA